MIFEKKRRNIFVAQGIVLVGFVGFCWVFGTIYIYQWRRKVPKSVCVGGGGGGGAHGHVIYVPSVKNQYKRVVFGYMVIY